MKILIIKFRNIGDVLLSTPLIENLKIKYPDAKIGFALNKGCEAMITQNPNVSKIHIYDRNKLKKMSFLKRLFSEIGFAKEIKKEKYDIAINLTSGDRGILIAKFANIKKIIGIKGKNKFISKFITDEIPNFKGFRHVVEQNLDALKTLNFEPFSKKVSVYSNENVDFLSLPKKFIHIHPTSRWMFKCISDDIMAKIIYLCENELGIKIVLTADKNETEMNKINSILSLCKSKPINLAGRLNLKQIVTLSKKSSLYIGVDTAIMHIAAANDVPCIAFFGPSGAFEWGPWDNSLTKSGYTKKNGIQKMGKHIVIQKNWDCVPCGNDGCDGSKISKCLMEFEKDFLSDFKNLIKKKLDLTTF